MSKKVLYFTATWCGPCQRIKPVFKNLEKEFGNSISFSAIDVDLNAQLAEEFDVKSMPTFVFLLNNKEVKRFSGANEEKLKEAVADLLNR